MGKKENNLKKGRKQTKARNRSSTQREFPHTDVGFNRFLSKKCENAYFAKLFIEIRYQ